jgi:hypothetical protein
MKTISLALTLIGCAQTADDSDSGSNLSTPVEPTPVLEAFSQTSSSTLSPPTAVLNSSIATAGTTEPEAEHTVLHCTSSAWNMNSWLGDLTPPDSTVDSTTDGSDTTDSERSPSPYDVHRMVITKKGDQHFATVQTGHPHDPTDVLSTVRHTLTAFNSTSSSLDLRWRGVSIYGWKYEDQPAFSAYGYGDFAQPTLDHDATPAPPCGFDVEVTCWDPKNTEPVYRYDKATGLCVDENNAEGLNETSIPYIRETKDGECARLDWATLNEFVSFDTELSGWNLRGASLEESALSVVLGDAQSAPFVVLSNAQLEGANLSTLQVPAGVIEGTIDEHTRLPNIDCTVNGNRVDCEN